MDWDYSFFVSKTNPFRKQRFESEQEEPITLIVNEANRAFPCINCKRRVGEVSGRFYEVDGKYYCFECGTNETKEKGEKKHPPKIEAVP